MESTYIYLKFINAYVISLKLTVMILLLSLLLLIPITVFLNGHLKEIKRNRMIASPFPPEWQDILTTKVLFYHNLNEAGKQKFRNKIMIFMKEVKISGVGIEIDDHLRLLVASSAIIPVFPFDDWEYVNLKKVLINNSMEEIYQISDHKRKDNFLKRISFVRNKHHLLLSKQTLEKEFEKMLGQRSKEVKELAHLTDEYDKDINEVTSILMPPDLIKPWIHLMYKEIEKIKNRNSDINFYGVNNHIDFFALVCQYFLKILKNLKKIIKSCINCLIRPLKRIRIFLINSFMN
jgi:MtfA peptidase